MHQGGENAQLKEREAKLNTVTGSSQRQEYLTQKHRLNKHGKHRRVVKLKLRELTGQ